MIIRKQFKYEAAHIVREAWSQRCSQNIHGHSYLLELLLEGSNLDKGQMILDFGLVKERANDFIDSFDHSFVLWNRDCDKHITKFSVENFDRVIVTPFSSSAEIQSAMFGVVISNILESYKRTTDLDPKHLTDFSVRKAIVHETRTGYAEFDMKKDQNMIELVNKPIRIFSKDQADLVLKEKDYIWISEGIVSEWKSKAEELLNHNNKGLDFTL